MIGAIWSVKWGNPYKEPPEGRQRVLVQVFRPEGHPEVRGLKPPEAIRQVLDQEGMGSGYSLFWQPILEPPKEIEREKLANIRRKRLERRMRKKYPLFAEEMIKGEMTRKPEYYAGITDPQVAVAREEMIAQEAEELAELILAYENEVENGMAE